MVIDVDLRSAPAAVRLVEPDDFRAFKILARGPASGGEPLDAAVGGFGRVSGDGHVFVDVEALRALAGEHGRDRGWLASLDAMLAYARARGWTDDNGALRGHVQWDA
jgi:hypothetical protein